MQFRNEHQNLRICELTKELAYTSCKHLLVLRENEHWKEKNSKVEIPFSTQNVYTIFFGFDLLLTLERHIRTKLICQYEYGTIYKTLAAFVSFCSTADLTADCMLNTMQFCFHRGNNFTPRKQEFRCLVWSVPSIFVCTTARNNIHYTALSYVFVYIKCA